MLRGAKRSVVDRWETRAAVRQARIFRRSHQAKIRVCWDLDNTIVNSGALIRVGKRLQDAIVEAQPVPNMLSFYRAVQKELPNAEHVILSARTRSMRADTIAWLRHQGLAPKESAVCFVPCVQAKRKVWDQLARDGRLVIVDDLSYNHESDQPSVYEDLVEYAEQLAWVYVGLRHISEIAADPRAVETVTSWLVESLAD
jgi:hypothetical protein